MVSSSFCLNGEKTDWGKGFFKKNTELIIEYYSATFMPAYACYGYDRERGTKRNMGKKVSYNGEKELYV